MCLVQFSTAAIEILIIRCVHVHVPFRCIVFLQEQRASTRENVERRMARTADELQEEEEEAEAEAEESDEEETVPYNPKNLPLGWDGKVSRF